MERDTGNKITDNWNSEVNPETLQKLFRFAERFLSAKYEYHSDVYYVAPTWVVNQFFEGMPEDKENDGQCQT